MPLSHSPPLLPPAEIFGDLRSQEDHKDLTFADLPVRTQVPPPSTSELCEDMSMATANQAIAPFNNLYTQDSMQWSAYRRFPHRGVAGDSTAYCMSTPFAARSVEYYQQAQNGMTSSTNYRLRYPAQYPAPGCPRGYNGVDFSVLPSDNNMTRAYPPASFLNEPPRHHDTMSLPNSEADGQLMQLNEDYDQHYGSYVKLEDHDDYNSTYSDMSQASTPYDDSSRCEDDNPIDKEQPYAQLIYRALLDAPDHTMILRDIYDWFRLHTDKAAHSETKGWQNSIRHNLSMNGAFEKVDQPTEDSRKGFMWRLTLAALHEGVKSTTRYRSKAPNKRTSRNPLPQRQASGAKGGHAARRAANLRRNQRARESVHRSDPRSDPYGSGPLSEWEGEAVYATEAPLSVRPSSSYTQYPNDAFDPSHLKDSNPFRPMLGMPSHLASPPRSYASSPLDLSTPLSPPRMLAADAAYVLEHTPGEPLFTSSPTPSGDDPLTPTERRGAWGEDVPMDGYDDILFQRCDA